DLGITTHIARAQETDVITRIVAGENIGTTILPARKKSNIKKWVAFSTGKKGGVVQVNAPLRDILRDGNRIVSILPVGITKCTGAFEKGDVVDIAAPSGKKIGLGIARYNAERLQEYMGQKGKPAF